MSEQTSIRGVVGELVASLEEEGVPATADPTLVMAIIAEQGMVALVAPPTATWVGLGGRMDLEVPVHFACRPPGGLTDWEPLWNVLPAAMRVCRAEARPVGLLIGDQTLPAYLMESPQTFYPAELDSEGE